MRHWGSSLTLLEPNFFESQQNDGDDNKGITE